MAVSEFQRLDDGYLIFFGQRSPYLMISYMEVCVTYLYGGDITFDYLSLLSSKLIAVMGQGYLRLNPVAPQCQAAKSFN